jgi:uncharacterized phiE125 gp8 family phage protein
MLDSLYREFHRWHSRRLERWNLRVAAEPSSEQISLAVAAQHLRLDQYGSPLEYEEQDWLESTIIAVREIIEGLSGLTLAPQVMQLSIPRFPSGYCASWLDYSSWMNNYINLHCSPVNGIEWISYIDGDGVTQLLDLSNVVLDDFSRPAMVAPALNFSWPSVANIPNAVIVQFDAGFNLDGDSPGDKPLPRSLRHAMLLMLSHLYENREATTESTLNQIPLGITSLIERYRIRDSMA